MTAEVAVLSRVGVALAADSAVTVDSEAGKVYTSADKLFQLSAVAPVGVMIYGNASFMDVPWETVLKTFRRRLGARAFDTLQVDPALRVAMDRDTAGLFQRFALALLDRVREHDAGLGDVLERELTPAISKLLDDVVGEWGALRQRDYVGPVMDMVRALPKDELALMAESLVNLDKFKRRVSRRQETVGGPIDVAVITKGDGFVWVRRKHYFKPELNLRLLASYLGDKRDDYA